MKTVKCHIRIPEMDEERFNSGFNPEDFSPEDDDISMGEVMADWFEGKDVN